MMRPLSDSILGEMQFCVRSMLRKKQREYAKLPPGDPNLPKVLARVERLGRAMDWLDEEKKSRG